MAAGNFTIFHDAYSYTDFVYFCCSSVNIEDVQFDNISVFPNPTDGLVNISLGEYAAKVQLRVIDPMGRQVASEQFSNTNFVKTVLPETKGVYFIYLEIDGKTTVKRVVRS